MRSIVSPQFRKMLEKLPAKVQDEARANFAKWRQDPKSVGFKRLSGMSADVWSSQIGLRYRALGVVSKEHNAVVWMFVGSHEDYNNYIEVRRQMNHDKWLGSHNLRARVENRRQGDGACTPQNPGATKKSKWG